ncbi:MAG: PHB depolymerase family esterase [Candidatus Omnitrophota bacterium]|nr:PHB depolymerase family esterase [Candidatus Omnitrophota bacterium]
MKKIISVAFIIFLLIIVANLDDLHAGIIDRSSEGYLLYVPKAAISGQKSPVLICLPGWGVAAKQDINMWSFPAEKNGFVVVGLDVNYNLINSASDVQNLYNRIMKIVNLLAFSYPVDLKRLYIAGTSAGGIMSISLALMYSKRFVAVGVVSGARLGFSAQNYLSNARNIRFYMVHGDQDNKIPVSEFYLTKEQLGRNGAIIEFNIIQQGGHSLPSNAYREAVDWLAKVK